jgi:D-amino-acid dehydrogenase
LTKTASTTPARHAVVIGGGIVGVCSALYLQREGLRVTLIERDEPGDACSAGNAGNLGIASCVPYSLPGMMWRVPRLLLDRTSPLNVRLSHIPRATPWFLRFLMAGSPQRVEEISDALRSLMRRLYDAYAPLLDDAGARDLVQNVGRLQVHESDKGFAGSRYSMDIRRRRGIEFQTLSGDEVREIEPALGPAVTAGYYIPEASHCVNPSRLVKVFAECLVRRGGTLLRQTVKGLENGADGTGSVVTDAGRHSADAVVLAAGAWSGRLAKQLGTRVPMEAERGYHTMLPNSGVGMKIPVTAADRFVSLSPMEHGLRVSGMGEFAPIDAPADWRLARVVVEHARHLLPGLSEEGSHDWMGPRPALPDGKPVIGRSQRHPWATFAFGHGHVGLGTGAITGRIVSQLVAGKPPEVDLEPFRPDRF